MPTRVLVASEDAHVAADAPQTNHGSAAVLKVESKDLLGAADKRLLCAFDLRALPSTATRVVAATLRLAPLTQTPGRALRCHEVTGPWAEAAVTWENQPAIGTDHGTRDSGEEPQEWNVTASAQVAFPAGRAAFRVKDDHEGALLAQLQEYASREGDGEAPTLVVVYEDQGRDSLACAVRPRQHLGGAALPARLRVRRRAQRYQQAKVATLVDGAGAATRPQGLAWDATRDALWVSDPDARKVRRYDRRTLALQAEYAVPDGFQPTGCAWDGAHLWLSDDASAEMTVRRFRVEGEALVVEGVWAHDFRAVLAWDGRGLWSSDPVSGTVTRHRLDDALSVETTFDGLPEVWGLAFPGGEEVLTLENLDPVHGAYRIARRRAADFALLAAWPYRGASGQRPIGLALVPRGPAGRLLNLEADTGALLVRPPLELPSTVRPANIPRHASLSCQARPGRLSGVAWLASTVRPRLPGHATLEARVRPRPRGQAALPCLARPREVPVRALLGLGGWVAARLALEDDLLAISAEAGSTIVHTTPSGARTLRRIVQLIDHHQTETFPRARTSELGRPSEQDVLRRGDALLFAQGGDAFRPGDTVRWQDQDWAVVGVLGAEVVGDVVLYQEVGLRRLGLRALLAVQGAVEATG